MKIHEYLAANRQQLVERWKEQVVSRLALTLEESQLVDELPEFIDDLTEMLRTAPADWPSLESASQHGRQRVREGVDIGGLTEEMTLLGECLVELAHRDGHAFSGEEIQALLHGIGRGTATSLSAYAALRDQQLASEISRHFSFVAHEIRSPLQSARLTLQLLERSRKEPRPEHLRRLGRALDQMSELVDDALVQARARAEPEPTLRRHRAAELVEAACEDVCVQAEERGIALLTEVEPFELSVDRRLIASALTNLLTNAIKFTRPGGRVAIRARVQDDRALFEVEDECGGLPAAAIPRLFQPFAQASEDRRGFGLGLMIVKQAAEAHNGAARVANHEGHGCSFVVDLPRRANDAEDPPPSR